jgi:hypothetical protein
MNIQDCTKKIASAVAPVDETIAALETMIFAGEKAVADFQQSPSVKTIAPTIAEKLQLSATREILTDFTAIHPDNRRKVLADDCCRDNAEEFLKALEIELAPRAKGRDSFRTRLGKEAASLIEKLFGPALTEDDRLGLEQQREAKQVEGEYRDSQLGHAVNRIGHFRAFPTEETYSAAALAVAQVDFSQP